jgi:hypothetical protein
MATLSIPGLRTRGKAAAHAASLSFDWVIALLGLWLTGGAHLDAWAHEHGLAESFFTPWHGVLYSGYAALALALGITFVRNVRARGAWDAMPAGYRLSLLGAGVFLIGGIGDMIWHTLFGIEVSIEALLSPTHLLLALGAGLMVTGPLRAAWARREEAPGLGALLPAMLSTGMLLALFSFFTLYISPFGRLLAGTSSAANVASQALSVGSVLLYAGFLSGTVLLLVRRWRLPFGSLTIALTLSTLLTAAIHERWWLAGVALLAGLLADGLIAWLRPSPEGDDAPAARPWAFRLFGALLPVAYLAIYFAAVAVLQGVVWTVELWAGTIVLTAFVGWLASYVALPPRVEGVEKP